MSEILIVTVFALLFCGLIILLLVALIKSPKKSYGSMTSTVLGANDLLYTREQSKAAEVIVDQNAGKKMEEQSSEDPKDKNVDTGNKGAS